MRTLVFICLAVAMGSSPTLAQNGTIIGDAPLLHAPGPYDSDGRTLAGGTEVVVGVCFSEGAYCYVEGAGMAGYVEGRLLAVADGRMDALEKERWGRLRDRPARPDEALMIVAWGDSLTAGALIPRTDGYPAQAETLFGYVRQVENAGIGGQDSTAIAARMNAVPTLLSLAGDTVPRQGSAVVVERTTTGITNQGPKSLPGAICGVRGQLSAESSDGGRTYAYQFTRDGAGDAVPCPAGSTFRFARADDLQQRVQWIWAGTNGAAPEHSVVDDIAAMTTSLGHDRYLVGSVLSGAEHSGERIASAQAINRALAGRYGLRFVDLVGALAAAADGSAEDAADVAAGITPRSLRVDALHLNARGNAIVAKAWHDATLQLGF